jgi:hypothetical protein
MYLITSVRRDKLAIILLFKGKYIVLSGKLMGIDADDFTMERLSILLFQQ